MCDDVNIAGADKVRAFCEVGSCLRAKDVLPNRTRAAQRQADPQTRRMCGRISGPVARHVFGRLDRDAAPSVVITPASGTAKFASTQFLISLRPCPRRWRRSPR